MHTQHPTLMAHGRSTTRATACELWLRPRKAQTQKMSCGSRPKRKAQTQTVLCCREEEAVLRLTEDAGFKRRVMGETGTYTPTTIGKPPHPKQTVACPG